MYSYIYILYYIIFFNIGNWMESSTHLWFLSGDHRDWHAAEHRSPRNGSQLGGRLFRHVCYGMVWRCGLPPGKHSKSYGKPPFLMGKLTISMAMLNSYFDITRGYASLPMTDPNGAAICLVCHGSHQYTSFMLALIYQHHGSVMGYASDLWIGNGSSDFVNCWKFRFVNWNDLLRTECWTAQSSLWDAVVKVCTWAYKQIQCFGRDVPT